MSYLLEKSLGLLFAVLLVCVAACGPDTEAPEEPRVCTLVYYPEGLLLRFEPAQPDGLFPDGEYRLDVTADGVATSVTVLLEGNRRSCPGDESAGGCRASLDLDEQTTLFVELEVAATSGFIQIAYTHDGARAGGPTVAEVTLALDGAVMAGGYYEPEYRVREANGAGCGVVTQASDVLVVGDR